MSRNLLRQGYSMKEKKAIVDYIVSNDAYDRVKGRELWTNFEKSGDTKRTWQSAKEVFIKRILPEISNPYYRLSAKQIKFFRTGLSQPLANTLDWICKDEKNRMKADDKTPIVLDEVSDKTSDSEFVLLESSKSNSERAKSPDSAPVANSDDMNRLIDVIGQNEPNNDVTISTDSDLISPKDNFDRLLSGGNKRQNAPMSIPKNVRNTEPPTGQFDVHQNLLDDVLLPSASSHDSEDENNVQKGKSLSSKLGFSTGKTYVSRNLSKSMNTSQSKNINNSAGVSNTHYPDRSIKSVNEIKVKRKRSRRVPSSTESSSSSRLTDDESDSYSSSSIKFVPYSRRADGTRKAVVKIGKPIYALYKGQLFPLYVARSKTKYGSPISYRSRKSSRRRRNSSRFHSEYNDNIKNTDSDESLSYYTGPDRRYKRRTDNRNTKDSYYHSSDAKKIIDGDIRPLSSERLPETGIKIKNQNNIQKRADLDFPNDEIEMRYYKDLERFYEGGQVGQKPMKQCYQRVLTEEEKRKHKKYAHLYKTGTEIYNAIKTDNKSSDPQSFWKIKYLMEKKNFNEVCKYMAESTPTIKNPADEITPVLKNNSPVSLNDKPNLKKNTDDASNIKNEIIDIDNAPNFSKDSSKDGDFEKLRKVLMSTEKTRLNPASTKSNCIIKYSKHGKDVVNNSYSIDTQREDLLMSVLKKLDESKIPETVKLPEVSDAKVIVVEDSTNRTIPEVVKSRGKLSKIQKKEKKIFQEIEKQGEITVDSSDSVKRNIFTPTELALLNSSKSDSKKPEEIKKDIVIESSKNMQTSADAALKTNQLKDEEIQEPKTRNADKKTINKDVSKDIVARRSPRAKTQPDPGPSRSTPKSTSEKVEEFNMQERVSSIKKLEVSSSKKNKKGDVSEDELFFANTKFRLNPEFINLPHQKMRKADDGSTSDSDTVFSFPKTPKPTWKISLQSRNSVSKRKSNGTLNSSKKKRSDPINVTNMKLTCGINKMDSEEISKETHVHITEYNECVRGEDNSERITTDDTDILNFKKLPVNPPVIESQEIPLQNHVFDFLKFFPKKLTSKNTLTANNTINFDLKNDDNFYGLSNVNNESFVNSTLPLLEQEIRFVTRSEERKVANNNSLKNFEDSISIVPIENFSGDVEMFSDENISLLASEKHIEEPKNHTNPMYEKEGRLNVTDKLAVGEERVTDKTCDSRLEENIEPLCDDLFNTTVSSCNTIFISNMVSNKTEKSVTSESNRDVIQETGIKNLSDPHEAGHRKKCSKNVFNISSDLNVMELRNIMTEEDFSE